MSSRNTDGDQPIVTVDLECLLFKENTLSEHTVVAVEFCELCFIDKNKFWDLRKNNPSFGEYLKAWVATCEPLMQTMLLSPDGSQAVDGFLGDRSLTGAPQNGDGW